MPSDRTRTGCGASPSRTASAPRSHSSEIGSLRKELPVVALTRDALGYAAGFFDGEGCVSIIQTKSAAGAVHYRLAVMITQADETPLRWFQQRFGGRSYEVANNRSQLTNYPRTCWALHFNGQEAASLLQQIEPLLLVKREQVQNALAFIAVKADGPRGRKTPADVRARLAALHTRHRQLSSRSTDTDFAALQAAPADDQLELHIG